MKRCPRRAALQPFPPLTPSGCMPCPVPQWGCVDAPSPGCGWPWMPGGAAPGQLRLGWWGFHRASLHPPVSPVARLPSSAPGLWLAEGGGRAPPVAGRSGGTFSSLRRPRGQVPLPAPAGGLEALRGPWRRQRGPPAGARSALQGSGGRGLGRWRDADPHTRVPSGVR